MKRIAGRVPVELGIVAAEFAFRLALGREVGLIEAEGRERADRLLALLWEVYSRYLQPTASDAGRPGGLSHEEQRRRLLAANAFFVGVAVLESLYGVDTFARWIAGELDAEELSA